MKTLGPLYVHTLSYYHKDFFPVVEVGYTQEITRPYREGRCLVFRLPKTYTGYVIGLWKSPTINPESEDDVDDLFSRIIRAKEADASTEDIREW